MQGAIFTALSTTSASDVAEQLESYYWYNIQNEPLCVLFVGGSVTVV